VRPDALVSARPERGAFKGDATEGVEARNRAVSRPAKGATGQTERAPRAEQIVPEDLAQFLGSLYNRPVSEDDLVTLIRFSEIR
jgi:hypothetical protein